jgi:hypothetical protein
MASKRPALHTPPASEAARSRDLYRRVSAIVARHVEEACERAWAEVGQRFGGGALFSKTDPSAVTAHAAARALAAVMTTGLSRLAVAALVLPARKHPRRRVWPAGPPRLAAIPGGLRRNGHAADGARPGDDSSPSR